MEYIFSIYIAITIVFLFFNIKLGLSLYLIYVILVPVDLPMFITNTSTVMQIFLLISLLVYSAEKKIKRFDKVIKPFLPIITLYIVFFLFTPFQDYVPFGMEFQFWQSQMRSYFILPVVLWYVALLDKTCVRYYNISFIIASTVALLYGLYLTRYDGFNPYTLFLSSQSTISDSILNMNDDFRLMKRISSVFVHPMTYGLFLTLFVVFLFSIRKKINSVLFYFLFSLSILCVFTCGIRTPILSFIISIIVYMLFVRNFKMVSIVVLFIVVGIIIIDNTPIISETIKAAFVDSSEIGGSSLSLRIDQLYGCFNEISSCPFFGKGYEWTMYYIGIHTKHPVILAFESVVYKVLCNWGYLGLLLFIFFYGSFTLKTSKMMPSQDTKALSLAFIAAFLTYCVGTGDYLYTVHFLIIYSLFIVNHVADKQFASLQK